MGEGVASVLVVGGTGLLGQYVGQEGVRRGYRVFGTHRSRQAPDDPRVVWRRLDITDPEAVKAVVQEVAPDLVVNAAAMTDVDGCERAPDEAKQVNEAAAGYLAVASKAVGAAFVHASTDYVFDGTGPATEDTVPRPLGTYGQTKLWGEALVRKADPRALILCLSAVFGWNRVSGKTNAVTWILQKLEAGREVPVFRDQRVTPTYAKTAAEVAFDLVDRRATGIFHVACDECLSRVDLGRSIADVFRVPNPKLIPTSIASAALLAKRPPAPCLVVRKVQEALRRSLPTFRACLEDMKADR